MVLPDEFRRLSARVRNWGRFGDDDRLGTLNFLTDEVVAEAARSIRSGRRFSLAVPLELDGIQMGLIKGRVNPLRTMISINESPMGDPDGMHTSDDVVTMALQAGTHWDALAHAMYDGVLYNGVDAATVDTWGAHVLGIERVRSVTGRGVLLDLARHQGVDVVEPGYPVTGDDLQAMADAAGLTIRSGDIVLLRTGQMALYRSGGAMSYALGPAGDGSCAGFSLQSVAWLHDNEIAAAATDTMPFECFPSEFENAQLAVHMVHLVDMGLLQGQNFDLEELAEDCAADGQYDVFLEASPQPFVGGCGSPVNPVAVK